MAGKSLLWLCLLGLVALLLVASPVAVRADDEDADAVLEEEVGEAGDEEVAVELPPHPLTDMAEPAPFVETSYVFVDTVNNRIPIGKDVTILCGFANKGEAAVNVSMVMGSLNHPQFFPAYFQNFTGKWISEFVEAGEEVTLSYTFQALSDRFEPADVTMALSVFYEDDTDMYTSTFFNTTVTLFETDSDIDVLALAQTTGLLGAIGAIAYIVFGKGSSGGSSRRESAKKAAPAAETGTGGDGGNSDWLPSKYADVKSRSTSGKKKRGSKRSD